eukprot:2050068-Prymnesium_polylepis.1
MLVCHGPAASVLVLNQIRRTGRRGAIDVNDVLHAVPASISPCNRLVRAISLVLIVFDPLLQVGIRQATLRAQPRDMRRLP